MANVTPNLHDAQIELQQFSKKKITRCTKKRFRLEDIDLTKIYNFKL